MGFLDVLDELNDIPDINMGGCGISALAMFRWLKKEGLLSDDTGFVDGFSHVYLTHRGEIFDSNGYQGDHDPFVRPYGEQHLLNDINSPIWNKVFDREYYIPIIEKRLKISLNDVKLF